MTTNAIDLRNKIIASDSRWSIQMPSPQNPRFVFWVDDTGFNKIADSPEGCLICAGDAALIEQWHVWFAMPDATLANRPGVEMDYQGITLRISVSVLEKPNGGVLFSKGEYLPFADYAWFAGSGRAYARDCYSKNGCSKKSVESASQFDMLTGGEIKYVELATNATNLESNSMGMQHALSELWSRGKGMDMNTKVIFEAKDVAAMISGVSAAQVKAAQNGEIPLSAPSGTPITPWSATEEADLDAALGKLLARRAARQQA